MKVITVDNDTFRLWFPYFKDMSNEGIQAAYAGAGSYISVIEGEIGRECQCILCSLFRPVAAFFGNDALRCRAFSPLVYGSTTDAEKTA